MNWFLQVRDFDDQNTNKLMTVINDVLVMLRANFWPKTQTSNDEFINLKFINQLV